MAIELKSETVICPMCGRRYGTRKNNFYPSYAAAHKGVGYLPVCKTCVDMLYDDYLTSCGDAKKAVRQMCRKLDIYWNDSVYAVIDGKTSSRSMMEKYLSKVKSVKSVGNCYDDTLKEEGTLWEFWQRPQDRMSPAGAPKDSKNTDDEYSVSEEVIASWGSGFSPATYYELEQRRQNWVSKLTQEGVVIDAGTDTLIRQICSMELDINRDRAAGKSVEKSVTVLNTLLGSANLKPSQRKNDDGDASIDHTPFGVWVRRFENQRPIPEPDPELQDVDGIIRYILTWFYGHLARMLNIKNAHSKLYETEIERLRVQRPEYEEEDDDTLLYDIFGEDDEPDEISDESDW